MKYLIVLSLVCTTCIIGHAQVFVKYDSGAVVNDGGYSTGCAWIDYDNDGDLDLYITNAMNDNNFLYRNENNGQFIKITDNPIVLDSAYSRGLSWADYDNGGWMDLFVGNGFKDKKNLLFHNEGDGHFIKVTGGPIPNEGYNVTSGLWGDYNNDGLVDLFVPRGNYIGNLLYRNDGNGNFSRVLRGEVANDLANSLMAGWADYDNDRDLDLYVCNFNGPDFLYENIGNESFIKVTGGDLSSQDFNTSSVSWADYDNDGYLDLFIIAYQAPNLLFRNNGNGTFSKISNIISNEGGNSRSASWGDYDNDGDLDLYVTNYKDKSFYYLNIGGGQFEKITEGIHVQQSSNACGVANADFDRDGDLDIFLCNYDGGNNTLYVNQGNGNSWIEIKCIGTITNKSAIGTKVRIKSSINGKNVWQMREISSQTGRSSQNSLEVHFGLGNSSIIDSLVVEWPSGLTQRYANIPVNQYLTITEKMQKEILVEVVDVFVTDKDSVLVPIQVTFPDTYRYSSAEIKISYDSGKLKIDSVLTEGGLIDSAGWMFKYSDSDSSILFAGAGSNDITGSGILFWLKFSITDRTAKQIVININSAIFNTGDERVVIKNGFINIVGYLPGDVDLNGLIQAYDASRILKYIIGDIQLNQAAQRNADVSLDSTISSLDASLILQYLVGQIDTLPHPDESNTFKAGGEICFVPDRIASTNKITIPLSVCEGENIYSFEMMIVFDPERIVFEGIDWSPDLKCFVTSIKLVNNTIFLAGASFGGLKGNGIIAETRFVQREPGTPCSTTINIKYLRLNENPELIDSDNIQVDMNTSINNADFSNPRNFELFQNYPNPFNSVTMIKYDIPKRMFVKLYVYNMNGQIVKVLINEYQNPGSHTVSFMDDNLSSGIYFYCLDTGVTKHLRKCVLIK